MKECKYYFGTADVMVLSKCDESVEYFGPEVSRLARFWKSHCESGSYVHGLIQQDKSPAKLDITWFTISIFSCYQTQRSSR